MLAHQVLALHSLQDKLRWKLKDNLADIIDYLYKVGVLDSERHGDEWDAIHHHSRSRRQRVSELLKQLCEISGERGERAFASFLDALRIISTDLEEVAECIEDASQSLATNGRRRLPDAELVWKTELRSYPLASALPVPRSVGECVRVYRSHLLSICNEQKWKSLLPERNTPGADISDWFVSVQAMSGWRVMQGSSGNQSVTSKAGEKFSVSDPVQLLMHDPCLYDSSMDVDDIVFVKSCMVVSSAGTGKTTLCRQLLGNYTNQTQSHLQEKFPFPVYIQCSDVDRLNSADWETVLGMNDEDLKTALSDDERKLVVNYLHEHAEQLLLIIDGVDEVSEGMFAVNGSKLNGVLCHQRKVLKRASLFITSRSCSAASRLTSECASRYALAGFTEEQLKQYMVKRLGSQKGVRCMEALSEVSLSHVKEAILGVPLFAVLVAEEYDHAGVIPLNVTSLYGGYLTHAQLRWKARRDRKPKAPKEKRALDASAITEEVAMMGTTVTSGTHSPDTREDHHLHSRSQADQRHSPMLPFIVAVLLLGGLLAAYLWFGEIPLTTTITTIITAVIIIVDGARGCPAHAHPQRSKRMFEKLSAKALEMLCQRQRTSSSAFLTPEVAEFGHAIGVLNSNERLVLDDDGTAIEFNHVSYQEYLAATQVSRDPSPVEAAKQCAERIGTGEETWPFWQFLCGLVDSCHLPDIILLLRGGKTRAAVPKKLSCFLMLCLLENQSRSKVQPDHVVAAEAISGRQLDLSFYHLSKLEIVGLVNVLLQISCEALTLRSCGITGDQVNLLGDHLSLVSYVVLSGNNLHGDPLQRVVAAFHRATCVRNTALELHTCDLSDEDGVYIARLMQFTTGLWLDHLVPSAIHVIAGSIVSCPKLKKLSLHDSNLPAGSGPDLCRIVAMLPNLTHVWVGGSHLTTDDASRLLVQLSGSQIQEVGLQNNAIDDDITTGLITFLQAAERQSPLFAVHESAARSERERVCGIFLQGNDVHRSCLNAVLEAGCGVQSSIYTGPYHLTKGKVHKTNCAVNLAFGAALFRSGVNDAMAHDVAKFIAQDTSRKLSLLDLRYNQISDEGACLIATALQTNSSLEILDFYRNKIGIRGLRELLEGMCTAAAARSPRALRLSGCPVFQNVSISNPDLRAILSQLKSPLCGNLRVLVLARTGLTVEVGIILAEALKWNKSLVTIVLSRNQLDDKFAAALAQYLDDNTTLQDVELSNNRITESGAKHMMMSQGVQRLQCVWMHSNPCPPRWYRHPLINAQLIAYPDHYRQFL